MQATPNQFEICGPTHPADLVTRLTVYYLSLSICGLIAVVIKNWASLGFRSTPLHRKLFLLYQMKNQRDWRGIRNFARQFNFRRLEGGLRECITVENEPQFAAVGEKADAQFIVRAGNFDWSLSNLARWRESTVLILSAYAFTEVANIFSTIAAEKSAGSWAMTRFYETFLALMIGGLFLMALSICHWYFTTSLRRRKAIWADFIAHVKTNPSFGDTNEQ